MIKIGLIADTHISSEEIKDKSPMYLQFKRIVDKSFRNINHIIHAGDIYDMDVIHELQIFAPVLWVRGNNDIDPPADDWSDVLKLEFEGVKIAVAHERRNLYPLAKAGFQVFVYGHSHIAKMERNEDNQLWINPGSIRRPAGGKNFRSVAILTIDKTKYSAEILSYDK